MRIRLAIATALGVAATLAVPGVASADPGTPITTCGTTVTTNAYLANNLTCAGDGVIVDGPSLTLDLHGHRLTGPGASSTFVGVTLGDDGNAAHVINGTITGWGTGIDIGVLHSDVLISAVNFASSNLGVNGEVASAFTVDLSTFHGVQTGVGGLSTATVQRSAMFGTGGTSVAFTLGSDVTGTIDSSLITGFGTGVDCIDDVCNITNSLLLGNGTGASEDELAGITITGGVVSGNTIGLRATGLGSYITADKTLFSLNGTAVSLTAEPESFETVKNSQFLYNGVGVLGGGTSIVLGPATVSITGNTFRNNGDGIKIAPGNSITQIGSNVAINNTRWGIYALGTVTDLGGNHAHGNGTGQCLGVVCTP
jgi:hypothetical protein